MSGEPTDAEKRRIAERIANEIERKRAEEQRRKDAADMARRKSDVKNERKGQ